MFSNTPFTHLQAQILMEALNWTDVDLVLKQPFAMILQDASPVIAMYKRNTSDDDWTLGLQILKILFPSVPNKHIVFAPPTPGTYAYHRLKMF